LIFLRTNFAVGNLQQLCLEIATSSPQPF